MHKSVRVPLVAAATLLTFAVAAGCSRANAGSAPVAQTPPAQGAPAMADRAIEAWRTDLLDLAFAAASKMPDNPHVKNRCRLQEDVVTTSLLLDQPVRAERQARAITDWRRGTALADCAIWCGRHGVADIGAILDEAERAAAAVLADPEQQEWRAARIRTRIAMALLEGGADESARKALAGVGPAEAGRAVALRVLRGGDTAWKDHLAEVERVLKTGDLDACCAMLATCAELYGAYHADADRRKAMKDAIAAARVPTEIRIELATRLVDLSLEHGDTAAAMQIADEIRFDIDGPNWLPEVEVALMARHAALLGRGGLRDRAVERIEAATRRYDDAESKIHEVFRAGALRPIAEAWQAVGDVDKARAIYARAVEAGALNPNARPRVEDLTATCCSMARVGVEPDAVLLARLREIRDGLRDPW